MNTVISGSGFLAGRHDPQPPPLVKNDPCFPRRQQGPRYHLYGPLGKAAVTSGAGSLLCYYQLRRIWTALRHRFTQPLVVKALHGKVNNTSSGALIRILRPCSSLKVRLTLRCPSLPNRAEFAGECVALICGAFFYRARS